MKLSGSKYRKGREKNTDQYLKVKARLRSQPERLQKVTREVGAKPGGAVQRSSEESVQEGECSSNCDGHSCVRWVGIVHALLHSS